MYTFKKGDIGRLRIPQDLDASFCFDNEDCKTCPVNQYSTRKEECLVTKPTKKGDIFTVLNTRYDHHEGGTDGMLKLLFDGGVYTYYFIGGDWTIEVVCKR